MGNNEKRSVLRANLINSPFNLLYKDKLTKSENLIDKNSEERLFASYVTVISIIATNGNCRDKIYEPLEMDGSIIKIIDNKLFEMQDAFERAEINFNDEVLSNFNFKKNVLNFKVSKYANNRVDDYAYLPMFLSDAVKYVARKNGYDFECEPKLTKPSNLKFFNGLANFFKTGESENLSNALLSKSFLRQYNIKNARLKKVNPCADEDILSASIEKINAKGEKLRKEDYVFSASVDEYPLPNEVTGYEDFMKKINFLRDIFLTDMVRNSEKSNENVDKEEKQEQDEKKFIVSFTNLNVCMETPREKAKNAVKMARKLGQNNKELKSIPQNDVEKSQDNSPVLDKLLSEHFKDLEK